jgi:hypothetical protein
MALSALAVTAASSAPTPSAPVGLATNASSPHTAPQYAALGRRVWTPRPGGRDSPGQPTGRGFVARRSGVVYAA